MSPESSTFAKSSARTALSLTDAQLLSDVGDYAACQAIGAAEHQLGTRGLIATAASKLGETLALFPTNLPDRALAHSDLARYLARPPR